MKSYDLTGKTALVTGASQGIGEHIARFLSSAGARVIIIARNFDKLKLLADELGNTLAKKLDIKDKHAVKEMLLSLEEGNEKIDICINNAAEAKDTPIFDLKDDDSFEDVIQTNINGTWYITKAVANHMKNHDIHGSIINIGSINGDLLPYAKAAAYSISKAAIIHLTKTLVTELASANIRINTINPGFFPTNEESRAYLSKEIIKKIPLGFLPQLQDLDGVVGLLASEEHSRNITGSIITIDGGISCAE